MCISDVVFAFFAHSLSHKHSSKEGGSICELTPFVVWGKQGMVLIFSARISDMILCRWAPGFSQVLAADTICFFVAYTKRVYRELTGSVCSMKETFLLRKDQKSPQTHAHDIVSFTVMIYMS